MRSVILLEAYLRLVRDMVCEEINRRYSMEQAVEQYALPRLRKEYRSAVPG